MGLPRIWHSHPPHWLAEGRRQRHKDGQGIHEGDLDLDSCCDRRVCGATKDEFKKIKQHREEI